MSDDAAFRRVQKEPRLGSRRVDRSGRTWIKHTTLGQDAWEEALLDAIATTRLQQRLDDEAVERMGYRLQGDNTDG